MLKKLFFEEWFPHWSPDTALRYLPVVKEVNKQHPNSTVLDVGSGSLGITPYLKRKVTGIDRVFTGPRTKLLKQIVSKSDTLPFQDESFDIVVCVDVLEHIIPNKRELLLKELLRVSKEKIFLVFPTSKHAQLEDVWMKNYLKNKYNYSDPYLEEHLIFGLPILNDVIEKIPKAHKMVVKNNAHIYLHRLVLIFQFSKSKLARFISSVIFVLLLPVFTHINFSPSYRKLLIVNKKP